MTYKKIEDYITNGDLNTDKLINCRIIYKNIQNMAMMEYEIISIAPTAINQELALMKVRDVLSRDSKIEWKYISLQHIYFVMPAEEKEKDIDKKSNDLHELIKRAQEEIGHKKIKKPFVPSNPWVKFPPAPQTLPWQIPNVPNLPPTVTCSKCGLNCEGVMGYCCPNHYCPMGMGPILCGTSPNLAHIATYTTSPQTGDDLRNYTVCGSQNTLDDHIDQNLNG